MTRGGKREEMKQSKSALERVALHEEPINISQVQESVKGKIHSSLDVKATKHWQWMKVTLTGERKEVTQVDTGHYTSTNDLALQSQGINCTKVL